MVELGGKELESQGFLQENPLEGSGFCFIPQEVALSSHLSNVWVFIVPSLLHWTSSQLSLRAAQW